MKKEAKKKVYSVKPGLKTNNVNVKAELALDPEDSNTMIKKYRSLAKKINKKIDAFVADNPNHKNTWLEVPEYPGYLVNLNGQIKGPMGKILKPWQVCGYNAIIARKNGKSVTIRHHVVLIKAILTQVAPQYLKYFIKNNRKRWTICIDHINNNRQNNKITNLQILTHLDNAHKNKRESNTGEFGIYAWEHPQLGLRYYVAVKDDNRRYGGNRKYLEDAIELRDQLVKQHSIHMI